MMLRRQLIALFVSCTALALVPVGSRASELTMTSHGQPVRPGKLVKLRVTAPASSSCELRVDARRFRVATPATSRSVIRGRVSARARPGRHSLSLRCSTQRTRTRVAVVRRAANRKANGKLFRGRLRISGATQSAPGASPVAIPTTPFPRPILSASAPAQLWWQLNAPAIVASFRNGQCTDWAQQRRPDIVHSAYMRRYDRLGPAGVVTSWDAKHWVQHAQLAGLYVARGPVVGAIMAFSPGSHGAGTSGHVAVVEAVASDGSFDITHMHAPNIGEVTRQTYDAKTAAAMATDPAIAFIH